MPRKKKSKIYFTQDTENAIVAYVKETDNKVKNKIWNEGIDYPLNKLAENIINTFKFTYFDIPFSDLKHEVVAFMLMNLHKYDSTKGKAFSYFSIVAKNYLILHNNNNYKKMKMHDRLDVVDVERDFAIERSVEDADIYNKELVMLMVPFLEDKLKFIFKHQRDITIADCVLQLFKKIETLENFNKKAIYLFLREMTGAKTQQITKVINILKNYYIKAHREFKNTGDIQSENFFIYE